MLALLFWWITRRRLQRVIRAARDPTPEPPTAEDNDAPSDLRGNPRRVKDPAE